MAGDKEDWDFKLDEGSGPKRKKKVANKSLLKNSMKEKSVSLETNKPRVRKSRRELARDEGGTAIGGRDIIDPAAHWRRGIAFIIDLVILIAIIAVGQVASTLFPGVGESAKDFLGPEVVNIIPLDIGGVFISFLIHFFTIIVPMASSQRSLGKKLLRLKILGTMKPKAPLGVIIIREYFAKPLSIVSIFGIIIIPLNRKRRGLHDFISGTIVLDN